MGGIYWIHFGAQINPCTQTERKGSAREKRELHPFQTIINGGFTIIGLLRRGLYNAFTTNCVWTLLSSIPLVFAHPHSQTQYSLQKCSLPILLRFTPPHPS